MDEDNKSSDADDSTGCVLLGGTLLLSTGVGEVAGKPWGYITAGAILLLLVAWSLWRK